MHIVKQQSCEDCKILHQELFRSILIAACTQTISTPQPQKVRTATSSPIITFFPPENDFSRSFQFPSMGRTLILVYTITSPFPSNLKLQLARAPRLVLDVSRDSQVSFLVDVEHQRLLQVAAIINIGLLVPRRLQSPRLLNLLTRILLSPHTPVQPFLWSSSDFFEHLFVSVLLNLRFSCRFAVGRLVFVGGLKFPVVWCSSSSLVAGFLMVQLWAGRVKSMTGILECDLGSPCLICVGRRGE